MIPTFGSIFGEPIPAYFAMLMVAFAACTWIAVRWAKREGRDHEILIDLSLISMITGVAGSRLAHVIFDGYFMDYVHLCTDPGAVDWHITRAQCEQVEGLWETAASVCHPAGADCFAWAKFWQGGLTWYGGMFFGVGYAMYFLRKENFPRLKLLDIAGVFLPVGLFFGRLGCWFGGCCFGNITDAWYGVSFPEWSPASEQQWRAHLLDHPSEPSLPVIPTQLMEAFGCVLLALVLIALVQPRKRFDGQTFCVSMIGYAVLRFALEYLRADDRGGMVGLTTSQWLGVVIVAASAVFWAVCQRRGVQEEARALAELRGRANGSAPSPAASEAASQPA